jgi:hypothetical protein
MCHAPEMSLKDPKSDFSAGCFLCLLFGSFRGPIILFPSIWGAHFLFSLDSAFRMPLEAADQSQLDQ